MAGVLEKGLLLGLGVLTLTRDKVVQVVDKLVEAGEVKPEEASTVIDKLVSRGHEEREALREMVQQEMDKLQISPPWVTRSEFEALQKKIDELTASGKGSKSAKS